MFCPKCGKEGRDDAKFCWNCRFDLRTARGGDNVSVGRDVGPGGVIGSGSVQAENIAGRDVIKNLLVQVGVNSELELEKVLRARLFTEDGQPRRDDVERWVAWYRARDKKPDLVGAKLAGLLLEKIDLAGVDLRKADLSDTDLILANLNGANLNGANLCEAVLLWARLDDAKLYRAKLGGANLGGATLSGAKLGGADLGGANLGRAKLDRADLSRANLRVAILFDANLRGADLRFATMPNGEIYRPGMDLSQFGARGTPKGPDVETSG